jgi:hypothetical protein
MCVMSGADSKLILIWSTSNSFIYAPLRLVLHRHSHKHSRDTRNYWAFGLWPSFDILKTRKYVSETGSTLLGPLERPNLHHWTTHVRVRVT